MLKFFTFFLIIRSQTCDAKKFAQSKRKESISKWRLLLLLAIKSAVAEPLPQHSAQCLTIDENKFDQEGNWFCDGEGEGGGDVLGAEKGPGVFRGGERTQGI